MLKAAIISAAAAFLAWRVALLIASQGFLRHVHKHHPGPCHTLPTIEHGSEDGVLLPGGQILFSSGLRIVGTENKPENANVRAQIYLVDMNHPEKGVKLLLSETDAEHNYHGVSAWTDPKTGIVYLYVVNHKQTEDVVERFVCDVSEEKLTHEASLGSGDPAFRFLNDLVMIGKDQFYYTNSVWYRSLLEMQLGTHWSTVGYFDGTKARLVESGLQLANGIEISPDSRFLYVVTMDETLWIYKVNPDRTLTMHEEVALHLAGDNLHVDAETGDVYVAGGPLMWQNLKAWHNPRSSTCSAQVLRVQITEGKVRDISAVLTDDGATVSMSSVAINYKDKLFIGSVLRNAYYCELRYY